MEKSENKSEVEVGCEAMKHFIHNLFYVVGSNLFSTLASMGITFLVPKVLGLEAYSLFQLYLFYNSYASFAHLGWPDGLLLRHGGASYETLDKRMYKSQWLLYVGFNWLLALLVVVYAFLFLQTNEQFTVILFVGLNIAIDLPKALLRYLLQSTNKIQEYAKPLVFEKMLNLLGVVILLLAKSDSYIYFMMLDLAGKTVSLIASIWYCREIVFAKGSSFKIAVQEGWQNLSVGSKLLVANISSMLIVGIVRFFIERQWDLVTFGKISLTLSISNFLMIFINAVGVVLFPMLRCTREEKLFDIYGTMRTCLMLPLLGMLVFYYPAKVILSAWLPQYADSLVYMALLFPICVFESKMSMLIGTYMKTLRKEKWLLMVNVATVSLSVVLTLVTTYWLHNLDLAVASIVVLLAFRCVFAELLLSRVLQIHVIQDIALELALTIIFITASWFIGGVAGLAVYAVAYVVYLVIKRKDVQFAFNTVKRLVGRK